MANRNYRLSSEVRTSRISTPAVVEDRSQQALRPEGSRPPRPSTQIGCRDDRQSRPSEIRVARRPRVDRFHLARGKSLIGIPSWPVSALREASGMPDLH